MTTKKTSAVAGHLDPPQPEPARRRSAQDDYLDARGREKPDPIPLSPPLGYKKHPTLREQIRDMIRSEKLRQEVEAAGLETFEEADDFDVGDDYDPRSPYEEVFDPGPPLAPLAGPSAPPASPPSTPPSEGTPPPAATS